MFNVAIIGAGSAPDYLFFSERCKYYLREKAKEGITIFATEENPFIVKFSTEYRIAIQYFYTDWRAFGKNALRERNKMLLANCNGIIWFNDGLKDTNMIVNMAKSIGTPVRDAFKNH